MAWSECPSSLEKYVRLITASISTRLKNIEETEKAKRVVAEGRQEQRKKVNNDEEHLVASRCAFEPVANPTIYLTSRQSTDRTSKRNQTLIFSEMRNSKRWGCRRKMNTLGEITRNPLKWRLTKWQVLSAWSEPERSLSPFAFRLWSASRSGCGSNHNICDSQLLYQ